VLVEVKVVRNEKQCGVNDGFWPGGWIARGPIATVMAVGFAIVAAPGTAHAYRTFADDPSIGRAARWPNPAITWDVDISQLGSPTVSREALEGAASGAWTTIAAAECGRFSFSLMGTSDRPAAPHDRRNTISVVSHGWVGMGLRADQAAYSDIEIEIGDDGYARIVEADIYLNFDLFAFGTDDPALLDLQTVLLHEGLHAWGALAHNCEFGAALGAPDCATLVGATASAVYPIYQDGAGRTLGADDQAGLCAVYGACVPDCPMGSACVDGLCEPVACEAPACSVCEADCGGGACDLDGTCSSGTCAIVGAAEGYCLPIGSIGTACGAASDCGSGLCLTSTRVGRYCTYECATDEVCGAGQYCAEVDGRTVCAPTTGATCAVSPNRRTPMIALGCLGALATLIRARKRRSACRS
jgi:hypothetical protein